MTKNAQLRDALDRIARFNEAFTHAYDKVNGEKQNHAGAALADAIGKYARRELARLS